MKTLSLLSDSELLESTHAAVREERRATTIVIEHLQEIERRKTHLARGYASLHEFCVKEMQMSDGAAHRRIRTMQLTRAMPEAKQAVDDGRLTLSNAALFQDFVIGHAKQTGEKLKPEEKAELLQRVQNVSRREAEQKLREISPLALPTQKVRTLTATESELKIVVSTQFLEKLKRLRELSAHTQSTDAELLEQALDLAIAKKDPAREPARKTASPGEAPTPRAIPQALKREIWQRDHGECQYKDHATGRKCGSRFALQVDHITPVARGGSATYENLQLLCAAHNQWKAAG